MCFTITTRVTTPSSRVKTSASYYCTFISSNLNRMRQVWVSAFAPLRSQAVSTEGPGR